MGDDGAGPGWPRPLADLAEAPASALPGALRARPSAQSAIKDPSSVRLDVATLHVSSLHVSGASRVGVRVLGGRVKGPAFLASFPHALCIRQWRLAYG